jgi:hypothetical protein
LEDDVIYQPSIGTGWTEGISTGLNAILLLAILSAVLTILLHCPFGYKVIGFACL